MIADIKNPIKTDLTLKCNISGGMDGDNLIISKFLNNKKYNIIETSNRIDGKINTFRIPLDINNNETPYGNYVGSGWNSTVIAIDCEQKSEYPLSVLKVTGIKKDHSKEHSYYDDWDNSFYLTHYILMKKQFNIVVPTIYFYGNIIHHECDIIEDIIEDVDENYNDFLKNKIVVFNISEYYDNILNLKDNYSVIKEYKNLKCIYLMKLIGILIYMLNMNYMIYDLKYDNIGIDGNNNVVIIDYDFRTFYPFKKDGKYMYYKFSIGAYIPCYIIKLIYGYIKNNLQNIFDHKFYKNSSLNDYKLGNINYLLFMRDQVPNIQNIDIGFAKISSLAIAEIILNIFFKEYYYINPNTGIKKKSRLKNFTYGSTLINSNDRELKLNRIKYSYNPDDMQQYAEKMSTFENLNDIDKITKFIYEFLEPLEGHEEYFHLLQTLLFDPESETGLFAPEEDDVPSYELVFKYFYEIHQRIDGKEHNIDINKIFDFFMHLIRQNIKEDIEYPNSFNRQTYNEWRLSRIIYKRNLNKSNWPPIPPFNSRFYRNEEKTILATIKKPFNTVVIPTDGDGKWKKTSFIEQTLGGEKTEYYYKYKKYKLKYIQLKNR